MNENDPLRPLLRAYRDDLRPAAPSPDVQLRLRSALRQQRRNRVVSFPRGWAVAAALVLMAAAVWWRARPVAMVAPAAREYAVATPPVVSTMPQAAPPPRITPSPAPKKASPQTPAPPAGAAAEPASETHSLSAETEAAPSAAPRESEVSLSQSRSQTADGPPFRLRTTIRKMPRRSAMPINSLAPPATRVEPLGERVILGYRCEGTRQKNGAVTVERWHAPVLGIDLLTKITDANGTETTHEVIEVIKNQ